MQSRKSTLAAIFVIIAFAIALYRFTDIINIEDPATLETTDNSITLLPQTDSTEQPNNSEEDAISVAATEIDTTVAYLFEEISESLWHCVRDATASGMGTIYDPANSDEGTATTVSIAGEVALNFQFDEMAETLYYTIESKPAFVPSAAIWDGIQRSITDCRSPS